MRRIKTKTWTISDYHRAERETENLYNLIQKASNLSDAEYWCLMAVRKGECEYQYEISEKFYMSKQTVNSALKKLVKKGIIRMVIPEDNQRIRQIAFTDTGETFARKYLDVAQKIENRVWAALTPGEQTILIETLKRMNQMLKKGNSSRNRLQYFRRLASGISAADGIKGRRFGYGNIPDHYTAYCIDPFPEKERAAYVQNF